MTIATIKAAQRNALVTIRGLDVAWHTMTGGGMTVTAREDPSSADGELILGTPQAEDIVLTASFSPRNDIEWTQDLKRSIGEKRLTVIRQWTDENRRHLGDPEVYPDCLLIGYTNPTSSPSAEDAEFSITLATTGEAL